MYQVWPVLPAFESELFDPYSPGAMEPSMVGVFHCARTGAAAKNTIVKTRASLNPARRISSSQIVWRLKRLEVPRNSVLVQRARIIYPSRDSSVHSCRAENQ